ncbi:MAG TPA: DNA polymerase III subunit delta [Thermoclostridium sp.]|nr:DNA polymerase III subunit delta [Thermoclostridium sp.]
MSMNVLRTQIKNNKIGKLYFFTGPEQFLVKYYLDEIAKLLLPTETLPLNYSMLEGKVTLQQIENNISVFPAFSQRRIVVVKESSIFKAGEKEKTFSEFFLSLPDYICLIFIQSDPDKRASLYKALKKHAVLIECGWQKAVALTKWTVRVFASYNKQISEKDAAFFVNLLDPNMTFMALEIKKISSYMGKEVQVTRKIIEDMVTKSTKSIIFDLTDAMSQRRISEALRIMDELIQSREPIALIVAMIGRQLVMLAKTKKLEDSKVPKSKMAGLVGISPYYIDKTRRQATNFSMDALKRLIDKCADLDLEIKTGKIDGRLAMELLLMDMN